MNITPDTDLETLNLSWSEKELPQKERTKHVHALHPYMGKFVPQIVETFGAYIPKWRKPLLTWENGQNESVLVWEVA